MKRIIRSIGRFFHAIYSFFDRIIITPITKLFLKITDTFRNNSHGLERILNRKSSLIIISLVLAFAVFFIFDRENTLLLDQYADVLYNQKVTAVYNEEAYVVEGLPEAVDITLVGQKRHIYLAKQAPSKEVTADLTGLSSGQHKVKLKYTQSITSLDYKLDPSTVTVMIYDKVSETRELAVDILHKDHLDTKLNIEKVDLDRSDVIIKGAEYKLKEVATVKALIDIDNISNPKAGEVILKDIPLVAYDAKGNVISVEIVPKTITATVTISSPSREVPLQIVPEGNIAFGRSIKAITSSVNSVVIYGDQETLNKIDSLPVKINVKNLNQDKEFSVNIDRPAGVRDISVRTVVVKISLDSESSREFSDLGIGTENLDDRFKVQALSEADSKVNVIVKGSKDILENLDPSTIKPYIDLKGYAEGTHEVEVQVTGGDVRLSYTPKTKKVRVRILAK